MPLKSQIPAPNESPKVVAFDAAPEAFAALRAAGKRIVQSHGIFDLMHPGHILHLEEARSLGDVLVVTLTADRFVDKGPGRPYFKEELRIRSLVALACVDYVVLVLAAGAVPGIERVQPHIFCRGKEYEDPSFDIAGSLAGEREAVEKAGGELRFVGPIKYSSTKLLNLFFDHLAGPVRTFCSTLASQWTRHAFHEAVDSFQGLKVLVVGDTIFDRYAQVKVQGLTSKNLIISGRYLGEETQCGGALAVFRHVREFVQDVRFFSLLGEEDWVQREIAAHVPSNADGALRVPEFTTVVKQRFVEPPALGKEMRKLFSVNYLDAQPPGAAVEERILERLSAELKQAEVVLLLDFGHGLMQQRVRDLVQSEARFLALNCQTNSNNHGFNIINRQYRRADAFSLDEQELVLACGRRRVDFAEELESLRRGLGARTAWLTRGSVETLGLLESGERCACPPLETDVVDTIGAGDAFFSVVALAAAKKLPLDLSTFLGQLAGAQAVKIVGNSRPISKEALVRGGMSLLNF